jgi:hypothetical protein
MSQAEPRRPFDGDSISLMCLSQTDPPRHLPEDEVGRHAGLVPEPVWNLRSEDDADHPNGLEDDLSFVIFQIVLQ